MELQHQAPRYLVVACCYPYFFTLPKPGFVGRKQPAGDPVSANEVPMAMVGRVPTKVSAENGPIKVGDLLVTSSTLGYAMKGTDRSQMLGAVVGKALGSLDSGTGVIEVLVTLQ